MNKDKVIELLSYCYLCNETFILDDPKLSWSFANIDGTEVPVCWGCNEMIESGYPV